MNEYTFPVKAIIQILVRETESKFRGSKTLFLEDETREMLHQHIEKIRALSSYKEINDWLLAYRRLSLQEWIDSF